MSEHIVRANGIELCCEAFGDRAAPPLVLIMGLGAQMVAFDTAFCEALAANGFRVVRFDNRDVGRSTRFAEAGVPNIPALMARRALGLPLTVPYRIDDMARDTIGLFDALGLERAHVVGVSLGGMIAQTLAIHHRQRLRSLTSIMSTTGNRRLPPPTLEAARIFITPTPTDLEGYTARHRKVHVILRGPHYPESAADDAARAARNFARGINPPGSTRQFAAILAAEDRTKALGTLTTPALVIHGEDDPLIRVEAGRATAAAIPNARLEIVPKMAHYLSKALWPRLIDSITRHAHAA